MLKSRILTALILAPTAIAAIFLLPLPWYALVFGAAGGLGAYEFAGLAGVSGRSGRLLYVAGYALLVVLAWFTEPLRLLGLWSGAAIWLLAVCIVLGYPASATLVQRRWLTGTLGILICWAAWISLVVIRGVPDGAIWVLWLMLLVWGADIGAYFAGRRFGHSKLAPAVSPGKTWEGVWGGVASSSLICGGLLAAMGQFSAGWLMFMLLLIAISVFGDLFESVLKRVRGVKDSGTLLPGHGGVLDRIDSLVAVLPCLALALIYSGVSDRF